MKVHTRIADLSTITGPLHLAIGVFDGIHLGHQAVIGNATESAKNSGGTAVVVTFDPHPIRVLASKKAPRLLASLPHQVRLLSKMGIQHLLVISFDTEFAEKPAESFVNELCESAASSGGIARISVGESWKFGRGRGGDVALLEKIGAEQGFSVSGVPIFEIDGVPVSSTRIREAVTHGEFEIARELLGRAYSVLGTVIEGRKLGRTLNFPTANLAVHSEQLPPVGVYAVRADGAGDSWNGVANLGFRPTVEGAKAKLLLEVHLFGLNHEIYGEDIEVEFVKFLRGEQKFDGLDALKAQIAADAKAAREMLGE